VRVVADSMTRVHFSPSDRLARHECLETSYGRDGNTGTCLRFPVPKGMDRRPHRLAVLATVNEALLGFRGFELYGGTITHLAFGL